MAWLSNISNGVAICRNQNCDGTTNQKLKFEKHKEFAVATIVYSGKLQKNKNYKTRFAKKPDFGSGSRLRMAKVLAPHNVHPKTVPLIKYTKRYGFFKIIIFPKK